MCRRYVIPSVSDVWWLRRSTIPGSLYPHFSPVKYVAVHFIHRILGVTPVKVSDKGKSPRFLRETIPRYVNVANLAVSLEYRLQFIGRYAVGEVIHFQTHHPLNVGRATVAKVASSATITITITITISIASPIAVVVSVTITTPTPVVTVPASASTSPAHFQSFR